MDLKKLHLDAKSIQGSTRDYEINMLIKLGMERITKEGKACEVGADMGRSAFVLGSICKEKNATLYVVDQDMRCKESLKGLPIIYVEGDSKEVHDKVPSNLDFVFIDGDHDMPTVFYDVVNFWDKLAIGGLMIGHDYHPQAECDVKIVVDNLIFLKDFKYDLGGSIWWKIKNEQRLKT